jgi:hypothetical protein
MKPDEVFQRLSDLRGNEYRIFRKGLPESAREDISSLCELFETASYEGREQIVSLVRRETGFLFLRFSTEMAVAAVRQGDMQFVIRGLQALAIENCNGDWRDSVCALAVLNHSAEKIGSDPEKLIKDVAALAMKNAQDKLFYRFLSRAPKDRELTKFGAQEGTTPEGEFTYVSY